MTLNFVKKYVFGVSHKILLTTDLLSCKGQLRSVFQICLIVNNKVLTSSEARMLVFHDAAHIGKQFVVRHAQLEI